MTWNNEKAPLLSRVLALAAVLTLIWFDGWDISSDICDERVRLVYPK